ncbi:MAG: hypothetical protein QM449_04750 [Synergistota bacterium]|nr:hypothetical protein [Synergistota bacterium]
MAHKRFISSSISIDEKLAAVAEEDTVSALMWPWLLFEFDDWGRAEWSPLKTKLSRFPGFQMISTEMLEKGIDLFVKHNLVHRYEKNEKVYLAISPTVWLKHQTYLTGSKRAGSDSVHPKPDNPPWDPEDEGRVRLLMTRNTEKQKTASILRKNNSRQIETSADISDCQLTNADICRQSGLSVPSPSPSPSLSPSPSPSPSKDLKSFTPLTGSVADPAPRIPPCPSKEIQVAWNKILNPAGCHRVDSIQGTRRKHLQARWKENPEMQSIRAWEALFEYIRDSCPFLVGREHSRDKPPFYITMDWLVSPTNFTKVREGHYEQRRKGVAVNG